MDYRSNLQVPQLRERFKHLHWRPMGHSFGHDVPSDWSDMADHDPVFGIYKRCGCLTQDEAAIVYNVAHEAQGRWLDIGCHTGWSSLHIYYGALDVVECVDPMLEVTEFKARYYENVGRPLEPTLCMPWLCTSELFFDVQPNHVTFRGVLIDGDHEPGKPLEDAKNAHSRLEPNGVIVFHDGTGQPVQEAVQYLMDQGYHCRMYFTPHIMFVCWREGFTPPDHTPDPAIGSLDWQARMPGFDLSRCE